MPSGHDNALPSSSAYAWNGLSPTIRIRMPPTMKAATTAIRGNSSSRASLFIIVDQVRTSLGSGQYHLAVAGRCAALSECVALRLRTHPLPRGGTDPTQAETEL